MTTERLPLERDLTHCMWHPERASAGWGDVLTENGETSTAGLCAECLLTQGGRIESADLVVLSPGKPCKCGPGFCASERGIGYYGTCRPAERAAAPDCPRCGAPHQGADGCWLCSGAGPRPDDAAWLLALRLGVTGPEAFAVQDEGMRGGRFVDFADAIREAHRRKVTP